MLFVTKIISFQPYNSPNKISGTKYINLALYANSKYFISIRSHYNYLTFT